jgi:type IV pilus assembly protein PilF
MRPLSFPCLLLIVCWIGPGCGGGASVEDARRSVRQYELAVGLREEGNKAGAYRALYRALELDPENADAHLLLGNMFLIYREDSSAANDAKAEHHFGQALRLVSDRKDADENALSDARNGLGVLYLHQRRFDDAERVLREAAEDLFNRQAYLAWGNLGWVYFMRGDFPRAIEALKRAVDLHRHFCVGYYRLGRAHLSMGDFDQAEQAFTRAIEADSRCEPFQDAWYRRGEARANLGHRDDAIADFERCIALQADSEAGRACSRYIEATH